MTISINDRRREAAAGPQPPRESIVDRNDDVMVQALEPYMEGAEFKNARSAPYRAPRIHAEGLQSDGFAKILGPADLPKPAASPAPPPPPAEDDETEVEQPDDQSRAPDQNQVTASTVPARPGAEPVRPVDGPVPPAATSATPKPLRRGRGRPARAQ